MKRAIHLLVVLVAAAVVLELTLQIGHAIVAWRYSPRPRPAHTKQTRIGCPRRATSPTPRLPPAD